jgi:Flp pilus assembly protein TadG
MASYRRRKRQSGQEFVEFALVSLLIVPMLLGAFVTGWSLVRWIQCNQVCRDLTDMYIHGGDFSSYQYQALAQRLAQGLNLQMPSFTGNQASNTGTSGDGIVTVSWVEYVGGTTDPSCVQVGAANCTNHDSFVFLQRVQFGNSNVATLSPSVLGNPTTTNVSATGTGMMLSPVTDAGAKLPEPGQTTMKSMWQVSSGGRTPLVDKQVIYIVETYFQNTITLGTYPGDGVYARYSF